MVAGGRTLEECHARLASIGLAEFAETISKEILSSMRAKATGAIDQDVIGISRLGGFPDLPQGLPWPHRKNVPLSFIGQLRIDDVARGGHLPLLPRMGMLYFFYDAVEQPEGFDPAEGESWSVLYSADAPERARSTPESFKGVEIFNPVGLEFTPEYTLPDDPTVLWNLPKSTEEIYYKLYEISEELDGEGKDTWMAIHRVLGHADLIQTDMRVQCQLVASGRPGDTIPSEEDLRRARDWRLLFQVDSGEYAGMEWGDTGRIYYWIPEEALKARDFSQCWLVLQCT